MDSGFDDDDDVNDDNNNIMIRHDMIYLLTAIG
jgi:hypothetical protein